MDEQVAKIILENKDKYGVSNGVVTKINFLKHKDKIQKLTDDGLSIKVIWMYLKESQQFDCSYSYFIKLYRTYINSAFQPSNKKNHSEVTQQETTDNSKNDSNKNKQVFNFSPIANSNNLV